MIDFHKVSISDAQWIKERLSARKDLGCEYCFGNIFSYSKKSDISVADFENCLIYKAEYDNLTSYCYPVGQGDIKNALIEIVNDAKKSKGNSRIFGFSQSDIELIKNTIGENYEIREVRDTFDYVYNSTDLINLKGKKYQPKRNHISFFKKNNNWSYETINKQNIADCLAMSESWLNNNETSPHDDLVKELEVIKCVFENYDALGYVGGLIRVDGVVVAYTMGEPLNDESFCVHFEKAYADIRGAYPIINQQFVENELSGYKYINREDDVGLENLRKAKLSYHPAFLLEKYEVELDK
ncbi:MAG: DUF2156 domain-containing protein [Acutalibacteraceae bacterium]